MLDDFKSSQPIVYRILKNSVLKNRSSHAYLFETKGYPKQMDIALAFAKYLLCPNHHTSKEDSQNCSICNRISDGNFTELKIVKPDGLWIKKEQLLELQEEMSKKSVESTKKVYIISQADRLNTSAANSILKFLEEPEDNIIAILLTENRYQMLDTILSRCQIVTLSPMSLEEKRTYYQTENETLFQIGSMLVKKEEDLKVFLGDSKNFEKLNQVIKFILSFENHPKDTLLTINKLWFETMKEKEDILEGFTIMEFFYKDVLNLLLNRPIEVMKDYKKELVEVSSKNTISMIQKKLNILLEEQEKIKFNVNNNLLLDKLILRFMEVK